MNRLFADIYLEKIAKVTKPVSPQDAIAQKERDLIKQVQTSNNFFAMNQLITDYRGVINKCIQSSGLTSVMDHDTAYQEGVKCFKDIVKNNFDLNNLKARPATYITGSLTNMLRKVTNNSSDFSARRSEDLQMKSKPKAVAEAYLQKQLGRMPTIDETYNFIQKEFHTGKSLTKDNLERLNLYNTTEFSGNEIVGGDNKPDGAESITFGEINNVDKETPEQLMQRQMTNKAIMDSVREFSNDKRHRRLIMHAYGMGEFKGKRAKSTNEAAINSSMTNYEAKKVMNSFKQFLSNKGIL